MQPMRNNRLLRLLRRLDRSVKELNALLTVLAIGLACLDFFLFLTVAVNDKIQRQRDRGFVAFDVTSPRSNMADFSRRAP